MGLRVPALLLAAVVLSSCTGNPVTTLPPPSSYKDAEAMFLRGDYEGAYHKFSVFASRNDRSPFVTDAAYWAGVCALKLEDRMSARRYFVMACKRPRTKELGGMALAGLGDCDFEEGRYSHAASFYRRALPRTVSLRPRVLYMLGQCYSRIGKLKDSGKSFEKIVREYPESRYAKMAKEKTELGHGEFSIQVGAFGNRPNAEKLREKLERKGFSPHMKVTTEKGSVLYVVRVGRFKSWKEAQPTIDSLKAAGFDAMTAP